MLHSDIDFNARKTLAAYQKIGLRRAAKAENHTKRATQLYLDLTNLWKTNNSEQSKQYKAIKDSSIFSDQRTITFLKFNYRNCEKGTYNYSAAYPKMNRRLGSQAKLKGTMQVTDLWSDALMHQVMGSPIFPRDRLKILKVWAKDGVGRKQTQISQLKRVNTQP